MLQLFAAWTCGEAAPAPAPPAANSETAATAATETTRDINDLRLARQGGSTTADPFKPRTARNGDRLNRAVVEVPSPLVPSDTPPHRPSSRRPHSGARAPARAGRRREPSAAHGR